MEDRIKGLVFMIVAVALTVLLVAQYYLLVVQDESDDDDYYDNAMLSVGFLEEVDSLNPYVGLNDASYFLYSLVYDGLMGVGADLEPEPNLAKYAWAVPEDDPELSADGMPFGSVWQYNLTPNAQWSDGMPFTAEDVVYNFNLNAQNYDFFWAYQPYTYFMHEAWTVDNLTVRVSFWNQETGDPAPVAFGDSIYTPILPKHKLETLGGAGDIAFTWPGVWPDDWEFPIIGTGPWTAEPEVYQQWLEGDHISLVRNENYHWGADKGMNIGFGKLVLKFYQDTTSMVFALRVGEIDVAAYPPQPYKAISDDVSARDLVNVDVFDGPSPAMPFTYVGINLDEAGPNQARLDKNVRQALAMATNKSYIVDNYYIGFAEEGSTLIPPVNAFWHYEPTEAEMHQYDMDAAAELLESSGYIDTNSDGVREATATSLAVLNGWVSQGTPLDFEILVRRQVPEHKDIAQYLKATWEGIGVLTTIVIYDEIIHPTDPLWYAYDMQIQSWLQDLDPNYMLFTQSKIAWYGWSDTKYHNASYDQNFNLSVSAMDPADRKTYVDNCQRVFYKDVPYIILANEDQTYAWRTDSFSGWGDWAAEPGRSLDSLWGGNPLFFELEPQIPLPCDCADSAVTGLLMMIPTGIAAAAFYVLGVWNLVKGGRKKA